jgi:isoquinoline 1-oxidoreductase beta subunit
VNPDTIEAQIDGAVGMALTAATKDEITVNGGQIVQSNFDDYRLFTISDLPHCEVHIMKTDNPVGGIGEPALPPTTPAVCNAIFAASGVRIRSLPFSPMAVQ